MTGTALSAGTLTGDTIKNRSGEELGSLEEIMIDLQTGRVVYVVLSAGGFLGIGDKYFAVPWEILDVDTDNHEVIVDLDKQTVENAPGFDKDDWPSTSDLGWLDEVYAHYRVVPFWAAHST